MTNYKLTRLILAVFIVLTIYNLVSLYAGMPYQPFFTPLLTLLAFTFALQHGSQNLGWKRTLLLLFLTFAISLLFECVGVATGKIYGGYYYTDKLGYKFLGLVPLIIPVAWFMMTYPSYVIATRVVPAFKSTWLWRLAVAGVGALVMTAWDLVMDPVMVAADHWVWEIDGAYFGIPLQNFLGWFLTALIILLLFLVIGRLNPQSSRGKETNNFNRLAILSYAILGGSTILLAFNNQLGGPALAGLFAMTPWILVAWWAGKQDDYAL